MYREDDDERHFSEIPGGKIHLAHYGGVLPIVKERFDNTYVMLRKRDYVKDLTKIPSEYFKNLYFDTSGSGSAASLLCALELTDASHILWGSDFPANQDMTRSIDVIEKSSLSSAQKSLIFADNFAGIGGHWNC